MQRTLHGAPDASLNGSAGWIGQTAVLWVRDHSHARGAAKAVLLVLATHARSDGTNARPSVGTLAREAGVDPRTVHKALRWAEERGEIERTDSTPRGIGVYRFPGVCSGGLSPPEAGGGLSPRGGGLSPPLFGWSLATQRSEEEGEEPPHAHARDWLVEVYLRCLAVYLGLHSTGEDTDVMNAAARTIAEALGPTEDSAADVEEAFAFGVHLSKQRGKGLVVDRMRTLRGFAEVFPELRAKASASAPPCPSCGVRMRWTDDDYWCQDCGCGVSR